MIKTERLDGGLIRSWSDLGVYIHGGNPEADYTEAVDPEAEGRTYTETDKPIESEDEEATVEDYQNALAALGIEL